jgi:hypothetical protein
MRTDLIWQYWNENNIGRYKESVTNLLHEHEERRIEFESLVNDEPTEQVLQAYLETYPVLLLHAVLDGFYPVASGRSALFSKVRLGAEFELDFAYCSGNSMGTYWTFIELERPDFALFNRSGDPSKYLSHALRQVADWNAWIDDNAAYASDTLAGLVDDSPAQWQWPHNFRRPITSLIVIGRRQHLTTDANRRRAQMCVEHPRLEIVTYDRLFDEYDIDKENAIDASKDETRPVRELLG